MDDSLISCAILSKDVHSFEYILGNYEKKIFTFIYHMVNNPETARDLTQDVFIKVYKNLHRYNAEYSLKPWIYKIAYNTAVTFIKKNKHTITDTLIESIPANKDDISDFEMRYVIINELSAFDSECRAIFILRFIDDLSFDQIALMLGSTTASVKMKFYRNRKVLIEKLNILIKEE
jgi:RNA polymerase sigma factor, sigma-70 family